MAKAVAKRAVKTKAVAKKAAKHPGAIQREAKGKAARGTSSVKRAPGSAVRAKAPAVRGRAEQAKAPAATGKQALAAAAPVDAQELAHGLNTLLHTMQTVQQFEESLCSLMHALRRGRATGPLMRELRAVLQQLPAQDYLHEVDALRDAMAA